MKRHKRKQKQWSRKNALFIANYLSPLCAEETIPSFPELAVLDRMREDHQLAAILKGARDANNH